MSFAKYQVTRLRWRHEFGGLLPSGFDPNSIAAEAIMEFLLQRPDSPARRDQFRLSSGDHVPRSGLKNSGIQLVAELGTHSSAVGASLGPTDLARDLEPVLREIKRLVLRHVTRLHHRKENWLLSNAEDLAPVQIDDGEFFSPVELIPDPDPHPDTVLLEKESLARFDSSRSRFSSFIKRESGLGSLFELLCDGVDKPQALASSLKQRRGTVQSLRKRLRRRWRHYFGDSSTRK